MDAPATERPSVFAVGQRWLKRVGLAGFAFFLIKGLLWLTVPFLVYWLR